MPKCKVMKINSLINELTTSFPDIGFDLCEMEAFFIRQKNTD